VTETRMNSKVICIHGHFYQPPRDDPLTAEIPQEKGADPYHDWNERIFAECYLPNLEAGNFSCISYNIGPTLFAWMEQTYPQAVSMIIEADRLNVARNGVGNAIAQPYNHTILPLATHSDKITQIIWGIEDFKQHFGRMPEGMWLPETAVDMDILDIMAQHGIRYTILAPWQAADPKIEPSRPYRIPLSNNREMNVFFYESELSMLVSFDPQATTNADKFVSEHLQRIVQKYPMQGNHVFTIASDGELYGHHQPNREKFLSYLVQHAAPQAGFKVTYPALWLKENKAEQSMQINGSTSWSCHHGVSRWNGTCNCTENAAWKTIYRAAFDELATDLDAIFQDFVKRWISDPSAAKNAYISVIIGKRTFRDFLSEYLKPDVPCSEEQIFRLQQIFQAQWERQRMYTSCAWFFEDFDRIEPQNNVAYLAQAIWLTWQASGIDLSMKAERYLAEVKSNRKILSADEVFIHHWKRANAYGFKARQAPPQTY
jgi:alpha-amylase/alpha-mannosidase (GH57 family)